MVSIFHSHPDMAFAKWNIHFDTHNSNTNIDTRLRSETSTRQNQISIVLRVDAMEMLSRQVMFAVSIHDALVMQI